MASLEERVEQEVAALGDLSYEELVARWMKAYGCPPPKGVKRGLLERAAGWHLQARRLGGLSPASRKAIRDAVRLGSDACRSPARLDTGSGNAPGELIVDGEAGQDAPQSPSSGKHRKSLSPVRAPVVRPGMRLMREWNDRMYVVDVSEDGFVLDGRTYRSLSAIARRITGAHWSGPRFFGCER